MKIREVIALNVVALALAGFGLQAAELTKISARSGSKMRIEGTSNIHDWQVESPLIGGAIDVGPNFPAEPGQAVTPGKVEAQGEVFVTVRSLKSLKKDGTPYSDSMDGIMQDKLLADKQPRITFKLTELTLKEVAKSNTDPYLFDAKGQVTVAGVSKDVAFPVSVVHTPDKKIKFTGTVPLKMTDFKIDPPAPAIALGAIKTGDDVKIIFTWMAAPKPAAATAAK